MSTFNDLPNNLAIKMLEKQGEAPFNQANQLRVRACNKENYRDIVSVLGLFQSHYGGAHALPKALTDSFWKDPENHLAGEEFLSLIIEDLATKKSVAHIGLAFRENDQHVEILLPAIHPDYRNSLNDVFNVFSEKISEIIARKKWERLLFLCSTSDPLLQLIAQTFLNAKATAFLSSGATCAATSHLDKKIGSLTSNSPAPYILLSTSIVGAKVFGPVYIPNSLKRFVNTRARLLKISFCLGQAQDTVQPLAHPLASKKLKKHKCSKHLQYSKRSLYGISILDCFPSTSETINAKLMLAISRLKRVNRGGLSLRVCLNSELSPHFISQAKDLGFIPTGIDVKSNRLFLILSCIDKSNMYNITLYSRESKALREDILSRKWVDQ